LPDQIAQIVREAKAHHIHFIIKDGRCVLALHDDRSMPYKLYFCKKGQLLWTTNVWAGGGLVSKTGKGEHVSEIAIKGGRVIVFGCADDALYLEAFNIDDGKAVVRFAANY
jgi:hypothetical protein